MFHVYSCLGSLPFVRVCLTQGLLADVIGFLGMVYKLGSPKVFWLAFTKIIFPSIIRDLLYWNTTEERMLDFVKKTTTEGDPASVLNALDLYYKEHEVIISLAPKKS